MFGGNIRVFFKKAVDLENCGSSLEGKMMGWFETSTTSDSAISHSYISHVPNPKLHGSPNLKWRKRNAPLCTVRVTWTMCFVFSHALSRAFSVFLSSCPYYSVPKNKRALEKAQGNQQTGHVCCALFSFCMLRARFFLRFYRAPGLCFLCFPPPVAFVGFCPCLVVFQSNALFWVARTLMKSGYVNCFGHFLRFWHQSSFATSRFQGSRLPAQRGSVPVFFGLAKNDAPLPEPEIETQQSLLLCTVTAVGRCTICIDIEYYNVL